MKIKLLALALLLSGCASQSINHIPPGIKIATDKQISNCNFLGDIHGTSMLYGMFANAAIANAKEQAFVRAKELNANTVVWQPFQTQYGGTSVHGNAYQCN